MTSPLSFFATAPRGLEPLLVDELRGFGAIEIKETVGGVHFKGEAAAAYRACLWSRLASRILLPLAEFPLADADSLYSGAKAVAWDDLFDANCTFAIEVAGRSANVTHTHYAGLRVKDAVADHFRRKLGKRPDVDTDAPDIRIHLHLHGDKAGLSLDLAGESLHRRGYRQARVEAPLRENLASAILMRAGWPQLMAQGAPLLDPMCGSGTLVIEAALMAADIAPGLARKKFGFEAWNDHVPKIWNDLRAEAEARRDAGLKKPLPLLVGQDVDPKALHAARENSIRAGFKDRLQWKRVDVSEARPPEGAGPGLLVTNPPYGERLGDEAEIIKLHSLLGALLKNHFPGWRAAVFTGRPDLGERIGLRAEKMYSLFNGALPCKLLLFEIEAPRVGAHVKPEGGGDFSNRLDKNFKHLAKWAKRKEVTAYRVYDGDLPDYAVAIDLYECRERHVYVQEYAAPKTIDPVKAEKRLRAALQHTSTLLQVPASRLHYRLRKPQRGAAQYEKVDDAKHFEELSEHGCRLRVNFTDYLDTGLFLDHRPLRLRIRAEARGKSFLNLFCYTGSATAQAVVGGAVRTLSVDLSNTYLEWAERNLRLNGAHAELFDHAPPRLPPHALLRADCLKWLEQQAAGPSQTFDLILLDPPTFSNSKKMDGVLDVQRDHAALIRHAGALLAPGGVLYFSTNRRGFKLDALEGFEARDITAQTLDEDFKRPPPAHRCWKITRAL